ncbi:hypothetical protein C7974DRAFT_183558 [Boeremia exigua]|uniref:uncharacterized protein n=1 Tax=Boeremia exigua TaxID=749465 RepID=UPI001E8E0408|nr:uncharacterized protein C7974DRAFT_183558 [Boeremia exigua]KAH6629241.1 hypothetical protein C7974DRAFT_183558 [Boeremia exigua]
MECLATSYGVVTAAAIKSVWTELDSADKELTVLRAVTLPDWDAYRAHRGRQPDSDEQAILTLAVSENNSFADCRRLEERRNELTQNIDLLQSCFERLWVPAICGKVYNTFPREIRDMIYNELHHDTRAQTGTVFHPDEDAGDFQRAYFNQNLVGAAVAREIAESRYTYVTFKPDRFPAINLDDYLSRDRWGLDFEPSKVIRHVHITLTDTLISNLSIRAKLGAFRRLNTRQILHIHIITPPCPWSLWHGAAPAPSGGPHGCRPPWTVIQVNQFMRSLEDFGAALQTLELSGPRVLITHHDGSITTTLHKHDLQLPWGMWISGLRDWKDKRSAGWLGTSCDSCGACS